MGVGGWLKNKLVPARAPDVRAEHEARLRSDHGYRQLWESALRASGFQKRYYAAASGGSGSGWAAKLDVGADVEISSDLSKLRGRNRLLNRDDAIASGLTRTFTSNVIGHGIKAQARNTLPGVNQALEREWLRRKDSLFPFDNITFAEAQQLIFRKWMEDGDVFVRQVKSAPDEPIVFDIIEGHRVRSPGVASDTSDGVERAEDGRVLAYLIAEELDGWASYLSGNYERVPADKMLHVRRVDRPGQTRGVPMFHAIMQDLRDLDLLMLASLKRVQVAALMALVIKTDGESFDDLMRSTAGELNYEFAAGDGHTFEPGSIMRLFPGEEVQTILPNFPTPEFTPFVIMIARRIGAALGVSWQVVLRDFGDSTYSSARTDLLETRQTYKGLQHWFMGTVLQWIWRRVMMDAAMRGALQVRADRIMDVHWIPPGWQWVDPQKEAAAVQTELAMGTTTLRDVAASRGLDWEEIAQQRAREKDLLEGLGLVVAGAEEQSGEGEDAAEEQDRIGDLIAAFKAHEEREKEQTQEIRALRQESKDIREQGKNTNLSLEQHTKKLQELGSRQEKTEKQQEYQKAQREKDREEDARAREERDADINSRLDAFHEEWAVKSRETDNNLEKLSTRFDEFWAAQERGEDGIAQGQTGEPDNE